MSRFAPAWRLFGRQSLSPRPSLSVQRGALLAPARAIHSTASRPSPSDPSNYSRSLPEFSVKDMVIVISGGAGGLGLVHAEALVEGGAKVYCIDKVDTPAKDPKSEYSRIARRAKDELNTSLSYEQMDVRDAPTVNKFMEQVANENNRLDGHIAAAGINFESPVLDYPADKIDHLLSINLTGVYVTAQAAARQMVRLNQSGSILLIASMSGKVANKGMFASVYNTSKGGVVQMGRSLAAELGQYGIRVNTLSPGYILTPMLTMLFEDYPERRDQWPKENMLGRFSTTNEYRGAAVFCLSNASSFMTGTDLIIDGGHTAW